MVNSKLENQEDLIRQIISDTNEIEKIAGIKPKKISVFVADKWKFEIYDKVLKNKEKGANEITKEIMSTGKYGKATVSFIQSLYKKINEIKPVVDRKSQVILLEESKNFLEQELACKIEIIDAAKSKDNKARAATPKKPGILLK